MTESRPRLRPEVTWRVEEFGCLLYDRRSDSLYEGNHTALAVLRLAEHGMSADEIAQRLSERWGVSEGAVRRDVGEFLEFLRAEGLLQHP